MYEAYLFTKNRIKYCIINKNVELMDAYIYVYVYIHIIVIAYTKQIENINHVKSLCKIPKKVSWRLFNIITLRNITFKNITFKKLDSYFHYPSHQDLTGFDKLQLIAILRTSLLILIFLMLYYIF